ncbi:lantibiotic dehydratase [Kocuria sp. CPCC 205297]|uniref:lantibiotic dehydratase n=1 Tax=Kocuria sp. CPCC 205297 TaxID=3073558 RepID=UPI0034D479B6
MSIDALEQLRYSSAWDTAVRASELDRQAQLILSGVLDDLHDRVPALAGTARRAAVETHRRLRRGLCPPDDLNPEVAEVVRPYMEVRALAEHTRKEAGVRAREELCLARDSLVRLGKTEPIRKGMQLSGQAQYREAAAHVQDPNRRVKKSRQRRIESSLTSYALRAALKPSPFGAFTELSAFPPGCPDFGPRDARSLVRLNVGLVDWLAAIAASRHEDLHHLWITGAAHRRAGNVAVVTRNLSDPDGYLSSERVRELPENDLFGFLLDTVPPAGCPVDHVVSTLTEVGLSELDAQRALRIACAAGLCRRGLDLPDHDPGRIDSLARLLERQGDSLANPARRLADVERNFGAAPAAEREALLDEVDRSIAAVVEESGAERPTEHMMKSPLFEDVRARSGPSTWEWRPPEMESAIATYASFIPLVDEAVMAKVGLHDFAIRALGLRQRGAVPVLELFETFCRLDPGAQGAVMMADGSTVGTAVRDLRARTCRWLDDAARQASESLDLTKDDLDRWSKRLPEETPRWSALSARFQTTRDGFAVLNGVSTAGGVFFSRYGDLLRNSEGWDLTEAVRSHLRATTPRLTDLSAVLGLNFNLHPVLAPREIVYPGCWRRTQGALGLEDLDAVEAEGRAELLLVERRTGQVVDLVPQNFLFPVAAPSLYRFLCVFAPPRTFRGGLWDQMDRVGAAAGYRPRAVLNGLILDRRSWRVAGDGLPSDSSLDPEDLDGQVRLAEWLDGQGVPPQSFFRVERVLEAETAGTATDVNLKWVENARAARLHKPHYLDVRNPFTVHIFSKQVASAPEAVVRFQECLPDPRELLGLGHGAEEFMVEFDLPRTEVS